MDIPVCSKDCRLPEEPGHLTKEGQDKAARPQELAGLGYH